MYAAREWREIIAYQLWCTLVLSKHFDHNFVENEQKKTDDILHWRLQVKGIVLCRYYHAIYKSCLKHVIQWIIQRSFERCIKRSDNHDRDSFNSLLWRFYHGNFIFWELGRDLGQVLRIKQGSSPCLHSGVTPAPPPKPPTIVTLSSCFSL